MGGGGGGAGKEGVVSSCTRWKGLSQKTVTSPLQEVGKTGKPDSKTLSPHLQCLRIDESGVTAHTNEAANF